MVDVFRGVASEERVLVLSVLGHWGRYYRSIVLLLITGERG